MDINEIAFILRKETGCDMFSCKQAIIKLVDVLKHRPKVVLDKPCELVIGWRGYQVEDIPDSIQEVINEQELVELAFNEWHHNDANVSDDFMSGFVAGYKKAIER